MNKQMTYQFWWWPGAKASGCSCIWYNA